MVELLKQPQYQPFSLAEQVVSIYAGTQGFLDELPLPQVARFEAALLKHFRDEYPEIVEELQQKGELTDELAERIRKVVSDFKTHWK